MQVTQFRAQLQEQHQETEPSAATAPVDGAAPPDGAGDDDIISDILKAEKPGKERRPPPRDADDPEPVEVQEEDEPEPAAPPEDDDDDEDAADIDADPPEEATGDIAAARAAADEGDLDKAFMIAFGKKPEELLPNGHTWTKWRAANDKERRNREKLDRDHQTNVAQFNQAAHQERLKIHNTIEALKPYEKYYLAEQAFAKDGDPAHLVTIIEGISKQPYNEAQKVILTKTRRSPTERALQERLDALESKLQQTAAEREQATQQQSVQQVYANDIAYIRQNVTGPAAKIPRFAERIYAILDKTRNSVGLTLTVEQAADRVVRAERRRIEAHPFVKKKAVPPAATAAARTLAARAGKRGGPPLRRDSQNNGARRTEEMTTDDIISDILKVKPTRRAG